ncbi:retrovirus-related Pol polyprotein from transposon 17.6 [Trichonephila clavipes]|nr:retrovirus-related Pol polyprotein from transposon 17.6 [Trichonephila clavipes]
MWADLVFELRSYLDNWLAGMKVGDFAALKELLEAKSLAEKLDHFEVIRRVHKKTGPTKTWERRTFDKQPFESKNKSAHFSGKGKNIGPLNRDPYKHEVSHGSSQIRRECPRAGESQFEKRKPIICYYCNETGHIKPVCPRLRKNNFETVANLTLNTGNYDPFKKFKMNMEINGIDRVCLRDSGSSIDVCSRSWINENDLLGEYVWLKSPLDEICHCLPLAKIKIKTKKGEFYTKAAIKQDSSDNDLYLLGNRTAELLESEEQGVQLVNAVVTRSKQKDFPRERKEANEEELELTDSPRPREGKTIAFIIPAFEGEGEKSLAKVNGVEFKEEQRKCPDLKPFWDKALTGIDKEFRVIRGKLVRVAKTKRGEEVRQLCVPIKDVEEFVKTCDSCQRVGKSRDKAKAPLKLVPIILEVFSKINIDAVGPLPVSTKQNRYLITSICVASKYPEAIPVESITSPNVIDALLSIFSRLGFPREIQSNLGTSFTSELTTTFFNKFGIKVTRSSVSHPQSNAVERVHRTIKRVIKALCVESGEDWEGFFLWHYSLSERLRTRVQVSVPPSWSWERI